MIRTGIDVVEISKIAEKLTNNEKFAGKLFSQEEIEYAEERRRNCQDAIKRFQTFAGLYAVKECVFKAVGKGIASLEDFKKLEVCHDSLGRPFVVGDYLKENGISYVDVSISHEGGIAVASCVLSIE